MGPSNLNMTWFETIRDGREKDGHVREDLVAQREGMDILAAGLAHDLNNVLMAILGHGQVISSHAGTTNLLRKSADAILVSARRAAVIVERLLATAALQTLSLKEADLNDLAAPSPFG